MSGEQRTIPTHLGLVIDGNRRWAHEQGVSTLEGHRRGYENVKTIGRVALNQGIEVVSAYVFSTENWRRSPEEVSYLMDLLLFTATDEVAELHDEGVRVRFAGTTEGLSPQIVEAMQTAEEKTQANERGTLRLCLNYGGQQEITDAVRAIIAKGLPQEEITPESIRQHLYHPDIPPPDLIIRTSGEQRLSNFLLWDSAYSELVFTKTYWPAFTGEELLVILEDFAHRQRRFGG